MRRQRRMSLILIIALLAAAALPAVSGAAAPPRAPLTPTQVNVAGSFEEAIGGANWNNDDPLTDMGDANLDGVWKFNATFPGDGDYEYKIVENADWNSAYPADNVPFSVAAGEEVGWYYDENDHYVSDTTRHVVATAVGDWPAAIGGVNWAPTNLKTWMKDPDGDGVYAFSAALPAGDYQFKVAMNESWDVSYPADNVPFSVPAGGSDVTFFFDSASNGVSFEVDGGAPPLLVTFPGDWPEAAGLGSNWDPGNLAIQANDDNNDGVWKFVADAVPAGSYQFKAAVGGTWDENYGVNGAPNGDNVPFTSDGGAVNFYYDRDSGDNFVASRPNYTIPVVVGDFLAEIGGANWSPDNLRSWMKDPDGDDVYTFIAQDVPEGDWQYKVAIDESWAVSYPQDNIQFSVPAGGGNVTFSYDGVTHAVSQVVAANMPPDEELVRPAIQKPIQDNVMYFALPDRMWNADPSNDEGAAPGGTLAETGFLATDKFFYHGGDLQGMIDQLDYLEGMGINAIWLTPVFENIPTQPDISTPYGIGGSYHGYWALDWENADPHLGTNTELQAYIDAAHARGIKVFFDIVANHSADIITYVQNQFTYRNKTDYPYRDANGQVFDDRDYALSNTFPPLDVDVSFPYTPTIPAGDENAKNPAWLNDPLYYHNRGDSTFVGESSQYGDFVGNDDLFTEQVDVVDGFIDIFNFWVDNFDIDGYRLDTAKHVNIEFWQRVAPAVLEHAQSNGKPDFTMFGEVFDGNPQIESYYTTVGTLPSVLDFGLHGAIRSVGVNNGPTDTLANLFASDDYFTDADSNAYQLATFISNHDLCRAAYYLKQALPNASDDELVARVTWGYAMLYFARGFPVVYYGDEQGFSGGGSDKLCREDMLPSQVPDYMDEDLLGTDLTPADDNFDPTHPLYQALAEMADVRDANLALRRGAQIPRFSTDAPGVFAFSRIERAEQVEYVVAFNSATTQQQAAFPVYLANTDYVGVYPAGLSTITTDADAEFAVDLMPGAVAIYKASMPLPASDAAPEVTFTTPAAGAGITGRAEIGVTLSSDQLAEVTFAVKAGDGDWQVIGTDTNPPYRVFFNTDGLDAGTPLVLRAIANDLNGHLNGASSSAVVGAEPTNEGPKYAVIHYFRDDGDYGDPTSSNYNDFWGLHLWGDGIDPAYLTDWTSPQSFFGEDEYGVFAWVELADATQPVNFIVHRGDTKDPPNSPDRSFAPQQNPQIWLRQNDVAVYESQADAQGYVTIRYHRPAGDYGDYSSNDYNDYWGLHLWTSLGDLTEWTQPKKADGIDDYGAYFIIRKADYPTVLDWSLPLNFILHKGDVKDPPNSPDRSFIGNDQATIWLMQDDVAIYNQQGAAQNFARLHYRRPAGDYGDYSSSNYQDFWGMHVWGDTTNSVTWTEPLKPVDQDNFGVVFQVDLTDPAAEIGYIFHRGDVKDPGPDQFLAFDDYGYEVWQLQGADPELPYVLPVPQVGGGSAGNINQQRAHWVLDDTIAWEAGDSAANTYTLCYAPEGGLEATPAGITGGQCLTLLRDPNGLPQAVQDKFPHLADLPALKIDPNDVGLVPDILKGQFAVSSVNAEGVSQDATGLQIPGVLDDLYTYDGTLGVTWADGAPTVSVWAPTAKNVSFLLYADSDPATEGMAYPMTLDPATGVWSVTGQADWEWQYYLFDVEVWVNSTQAVEHNLVTDPYSFSLAMNSTRSQIVDLSDASLEPEGWNDLQKPPLPDPEDISLYELHMRDFSVNDPTVPDDLKGTYMAFTLPNSNGMQHLKALQQAGLSHLHLLPVFDIATIDENKSMWQSPTFDELAQYGPAAEDQQALVSATADLDAFNWGYDPWHYTTPEGSYSTDPDGAARILEFREMVKALNETGLRVVMDVVYNHTNSSGQAPKSVLDKIVPGYYHRLDDKGAVETSTCCQNTATEHTMMEKLMVDSVDTWATAYKIDGFRFDLMGHHMKSNMLEVRDSLDSLTVANSGVDGSEIYVYGEGWNFGEVADNARGINATQLNMAGTGIGTFNDRLRDGVRGGGPFDNRDDLVRNQGFANGQYYDPNSLSAGLPNALQTLLHQIDLIKVGMTGNLAAYQLIDAQGNLVAGSDVDYNGSPAGYTEDPQEDINYVSAHDNQTLWDINTYKIPTQRTPAERVRAQVVAEAPVLLGQGIPFVHAGADLMRSKSMDRDSYNSGDWFNRIDWTMQSNEFGMGLPVAGVNQDNWYLMAPLLSNPDIAPQPADIQLGTAMLQEMYEIRYSSPLFRLQTAQEVEDHLTFYNNGPDQLPGLIVAGLSDAGDTDLDPAREQIVVLINANDEPQTFTDASLANMDLALNVIQANGVDDVVKTATYDSATGSFTVPGRTAAVFDDFLGVTGEVTQTPSTSPVVIGTYIDVDVSATNYGDTLADALFLAPIDPDTEYVPGSAYGGAYPLTAAYAAQLAAEKGLPNLADAAEGRAPDDVVAVAWAGQFPNGETVDFGFAVRVTTSSGEVQTSVALFDGATFVTSFDSDPLAIVDNSTYPVNRSMRFNVDRDSYINGTQPNNYYGSDQTMWVGFYDQMRPVVHTPLNGIATDSPVDQAWLYLYVTEGRKFGNWSQSVLQNVTAHPATTEWMPYAVNWWMPWTMPGGDYGPGGVPNHLGSGKIGTWLRLDVTAAVEDMLRSGANQGFLINSSVNASGVHYGLATKEYWDPSKLGYIRVYYRTAS